MVVGVSPSGGLPPLSPGERVSEGVPFCVHGCSTMVLCAPHGGSLLTHFRKGPHPTCYNPSPTLKLWFESCCTSARWADRHGVAAQCSYGQPRPVTSRRRWAVGRGLRGRRQGWPGPPGAPESHGLPEASASRKLAELLGLSALHLSLPICEMGTIKDRSPPTKTDPLQHLFLVTKRNPTRI